MVRDLLALNPNACLDKVFAERRFKITAVLLD